MPKSSLVVYHSYRGRTKQMAEAVAEGLSAGGVEPIVKLVKDVTFDDVVAADGVAFGTPQPFGLVSGPMKIFFEENWDQRERLAGKPVVCFVKGNRNVEPMVSAMETIFKYYGMSKAADGVGGIEVDDQLIDSCRNLGKSLAAAISSPS